LLKTENSKLVPGIYVHIPFCERKCTYCNFNTTDYLPALAESYVKAVAREISGYRSSISVDSIYFGGGTPSIVTPDHISRLIQECRNAFTVTPDAEVTIEINPGTLSKQKMQEWRAAGVNRASVGVQSFIDAELEALSRTHTAARAIETFNALRESGFDNISLDLIAGLPDQTIADWEYNLSQALGLRPEHLSLYLLEVKEGTQLFSQINRGQRPAPDDDVAAAMYQLICDAAASAGYEQYEISNFSLNPAAGGAERRHSRRGRVGASPFRSKHNMKYWTGTPFYGMGCGAHSFDGNSRWTNIKKTEVYIDSVMSTGKAVAETTPLSAGDKAAEAIFMGLRLLEGIDLAEFRSRYGVDIENRYGKELLQAQEDGLVETSGSRLRLTRKGLVLSNEVFVIFV
jgi:oxygen-independent coproporphyrinogen-3 oxidase